MGILLKFATQRLDEAIAEAKKFAKGPIRYVRENEPVRKMVLLEFLDMVPGRQRQATKWEHKIEPSKT